MQVYRGIAALSDFRKTKLLAQLQAVDPSVDDVDAEYVHFADIDQKLSADDESRLQQLTTYGTTFAGSNEGRLYLVVPRTGTISPWSSKATDIVHNSGLTMVKRIERGIAYYIRSGSSSKSGSSEDNTAVAELLHDRMTETVLNDLDAAKALFEVAKPAELRMIDISSGKSALVNANKELGLALADDEVEYLYKAYQDLGRNPTDAELMMFAQVNSEHCRHKIFNADWTIDGKAQPKSLFKMIKNTYEKGSQDVLSAYSDNAAVIKGPKAGRFFNDPASGIYDYHQEPIHSVIKVETHNHPTAIAPIPGAATGIGGEIRDESATGRGAKSKMGLTGYTVSNLEIPNYLRPWEKPYGKPDRIVSALDIMLEAPIGGASFANEFGRPNLTGYFRTYQQQIDEDTWGYHKPIMVAGGLGNIRDEHVHKNQLPVGSLVIVLGGPAMLIGLGGGAASSMQTGASDASLDFASVQRGNGEIERRAQEVIDSCWARGDKNPIITIHDVGAGGLSNALPELVHDSGRGALFELRDIPSAEPSLSPLEIWCNEAQERYVLGISPDDLQLFTDICARERSPFAVVGTVTEEQQLVVNDSLFGNKPVDIPMEVLFGKPPKMTREIARQSSKRPDLDFTDIDLEAAIERVLKLPAVGSKKFLITIGDRTVGGLVTRDQMVGPWQVPIADAAVTAVAFDSSHGEAMAMGERTPLAVIDAPAAARMAIGEAITNLASTDIAKLSDIKLSANWMASVGSGKEDENLYDSVLAVGEEFAPDLGLTIPVGKDSLSMRTKWQDGGVGKSVTSPVSLIITGFSPVQDVTKTLTPQLNTEEETALVLIDLSEGQTRLGGSALAQVYNQVGGTAPNANAEVLKHFFQTLTDLKQAGKILAYHDRSDGGLLATALEMAFASRCGLELDLGKLVGSPLEKLFNEELGAVIQVKQSDVASILKAFGLVAVNIGHPASSQDIIISDGHEIYRNTRAQLESWWSDTSYQLQKLRDNPNAADQEYAAIQDDKDPGLSAQVNFGVYTKRYTKVYTPEKYTSRPKVAIFREQGVNGQIEMAAAFDQAGFTSVDVHLNDIISGKHDLSDFVGLAACGGFSYGDVLGAGEGWAKSILFNDDLRAKFSTFFEREDTFTLGVCNGCQMLAALKELIPGAEKWPTFLKNASEQFEARVVMAQINESPSIFFKDMAGSKLPIPVAHGEGRAEFTGRDQQEALIVAQYIDSKGKVTEQYPANPNGSPQGITALTTPDGRATILMPHPERAFQTRQLSWHPADWGADSPWLRIFQNARTWVEQNKK
ncbi:MAG: phosphoribosylformylglycinamidine synthase [Patescibacteria group bacterium]